MAEILSPLTHRAAWIPERPIYQSLAPIDRGAFWSVFHRQVRSCSRVTTITFPGGGVGKIGFRALV